MRSLPKPDPDPRDLTDAALHCAIGACAKSQHESDRDFAAECKAELLRRRALRYGSNLQEAA